MSGNKLILIALTTLIAFSTFLVAPHKTMANTGDVLKVIGGSLVSCAVQQGGQGLLKKGIDAGINALRKEAGDFIKNALGLEKIGKAIGGSIPTDDSGSQKRIEEFKTQEFTEKVLECAAIRAANKLLDNLTEKTINWIATGNFDGGSMYVPNLNVYLRDQANFANITFYNQMREFMARGQWEFGDVVFENVFINSAGRPFTSNIKPVPRQFMRNFSQGSWNAFLDLSHPYGNPIGQTLAALEEKEELESVAAEEALEEVRQGQGFPPQKTQRVCIQRGSKVGGCIKFAPQTVTAPGRAIAGLADKALGSDLSRLELANRVDQITLALINRLLSDVFKKGGFSARFESFTPGQINVNISVSPGTVTFGETFAVRWSHDSNSDATQCYLDGRGTFEQFSGAEAKKGEKFIQTAGNALFDVSEKTDVKYRYTCTHRTTGASGGAEVSVTINPAPEPAPEPTP